MSSHACFVSEVTSTTPLTPTTETPAAATQQLQSSASLDGPASSSASAVFEPIKSDPSECECLRAIVANFNALCVCLMLKWIVSMRADGCQLCKPLLCCFPCMFMTMGALTPRSVSMVGWFVWPGVDTGFPPSSGKKTVSRHLQFLTGMICCSVDQYDLQIISLELHSHGVYVMCLWKTVHPTEVSHSSLTELLFSMRGIGIQSN